ncbi:hypothetical protein AAG906_026346 [Vitis piasezkii]
MVDVETQYSIMEQTDLALKSSPSDCAHKLATPSYPIQIESVQTNVEMGH